MKVITRMVPESGIELEGVLRPYGRSQLREDLRRLTIIAGGRMPGTQVPYRCIPARHAGLVQILQSTLAEPEERGLVFVPLNLLDELSEQDRWASAFGMGAFLINDPAIAHALTDHGLAERETKGGYHGTEKLAKLLAELEY